MIVLAMDITIGRSVEQRRNSETANLSACLDFIGGSKV